METKISRIFLRELRRQWPLTLALLIAVAGAVALGLMPPLVLEQAVNRLTSGAGMPLTLALLYFGTLALAGVFDSAKEFLLTVLGQKLTRALRGQMCRKLSHLSAAWFAGREPGAVASRFVGDVDTVESLFSSGIVSMAVDACKVLSILAIIFAKSKGLGVLMLLATPLLLWMTRTFQKRMLTSQLANRAAVSRVSHHVPETIRCIRMIHTLRKERFMARRYDAAIQDGYRAMEKSNFYDSIYSPIVLVVSAVVVAVMMVCASLGGGMEEFFGMSVGTAVAVMAYVGKVFGPLESIGMEIQSVQSAVAGVRRIREFLQEPEQAQGDASVTMDTLRRSGAPAVAVEHVRFGYDESRDVLQDCTFTVAEGESVTLTGRTGAGKSTVFKLLLGLYRPGAGRVQIFGTDAVSIPPALRRRLFGYVEQSFHLVPGTVLEQITLWDGSISREMAEKSARLVGLHDSISALPQGYDTPCAEGLFSQGQFQLLSIARAVAADPAILLLDEITANLDGETEHTVLTALERAAENRTLVSISHRLYRRTGGRQIPIAGEDTGENMEVVAVSGEK